ncbi:hypothetical protein [Oceanisphaera pacifica]|uniref:Cysteinyl-tRNA synthetase n=1 Tax=Oceanisphaera pacifica TaxID=2818389 RepID=A0ABS3NGR9_9GAMM|nr:hypothetical protein [Oceanisphaera pacifica]MBO1519740.1 hypothetical protein [Oceanisphaera pacifica]
MEIQEGALTFKFDTANGSLASQYDEWNFYCKQFITIATGTKAVDFIYFDNPDKTCWLIEVKDYRHPETVKIKPSELGEVVAMKVRDTLAGLTAARFSANDAQEKLLANKLLKANRIKVVLHMEQNKRRDKYIDPADVRQKLKQKLRSVDTNPSVVDKNKMKTNMKWTVK